MNKAYFSDMQRLIQSATMGSSNILLMAGLAALGVGTLLVIVGVATPAWSVGKLVTLEFEEGPFKSCIGDKCGVTGSDDNAVNAVKAMSVIGLICGCSAFLVLIFILFRNDQTSVLPNVVAGLTWAAFGFNTIAEIIWADKVHKDFDVILIVANMTLSYSYALFIVGSILQTIGGTIGSLGAKRMGQPSSTSSSLS